MLKTQLELKDIQKLEFEMLCSFDRFAVQNNLHYYLAYGTLLGAVRHKGFIPWDDDIDLFMPRQDYEKMISLIKEGCTFDNTDYSIKYPTDEDYMYTVVKMIHKNTLSPTPNVKSKYHLGLVIDIFPLDYVWDDQNKIKKHRKNIVKCNFSIFSICDNNANIIKKILKKIISLFKRNILHHDLNYYKQKILETVPAKEGKNIGSLYFCHRDQYIFDSNWFSKTEKLQFGDSYFPAPSNYKEVLTSIYGDYMKLPDEKERLDHGRSIGTYLLNK